MTSSGNNHKSKRMKTYVVRLNVFVLGYYLTMEHECDYKLAQ